MKNSTSILIAGATTGGKTFLSISLAKRLHYELINSDKFYLFKGFNIGIGFDESQYTNTKLHLYQILEPFDLPYSIENYVKKVSTLINNIPTSSSGYIIEGCSFSYNEALIKRAKELRIKKIIGLKWENDILFQEFVSKRIETLFDKGLINETENLLACGLTKTYVMQKSIIYKYVVEYLSAKISLENAKELMLQHFSLSAKYQQERYNLLREITWFDSHAILNSEITFEQLMK